LIEDEGDEAAAGGEALTGARFMKTWVHWRLRCAKARAATRLHQQLTPLERLQAEARGALAAAASDGGGGTQQQKHQEKGGSNISRNNKAGAAYLEAYLSSACPLLVREFNWFIIALLAFIHTCRLLCSLETSEEI
jgi:hypothetical protein